MTGRLLAPVAVLMALVLVSAACGGDESGPAEGTAGDQVRDGEDGSESSGVIVDTAETDLGTVLVDGDGMTLYLFTSDVDGEPTCEDACAETWTPLVADGEPIAAGEVDASSLGAVQRADGSTQITYAGHPLYGYVSDEEPGDVTGHGVNDAWFAVTPAGEPARTPSPEPSIGY